MTEQSKRGTFVPHQVQFVGEQDGAPERELKERLGHSLRPMGVRKAYLAVVSYEERKGPQNAAGDEAAPALNVALCVALGDGAAERQDIVQRAGHDFAAIFGPTQHMDIIFLSDQQEAALNKVCRPFYIAMESA
jgi:hypothetical protein